MIPVFLAIAAALIAAVVLSVKRNEVGNELIFPSSDLSQDCDGEEKPYDMLVGALSSMPQLKVCLEHNFYHIPAKLVPIDGDKIQYVAIYQSRRFFGSENSGVRYFARVKSVTTLPRYKITELPKKSVEPYLRFDLEKWQTRIKPISASAKGVVVGYTKFEIFNAAEEVPQLWLRNTDEVGLYSALKAAREDKAVWNGINIAAKGKAFRLTQNGKLMAICTVKAFEKAPVKTVAYLMKQIKANKEN
jgi:hypothetical protein